MAARRTGPNGAAALFACVALCMLHPLTGAAAADTAADAALGRRLFLGRVPLQATVRGEAATLPVAASRCINCHSPGRASAAGMAPSLTAWAARRGGPAFAYDAASMCTTLRTGIDPQQVWLSLAMPRFRLTPRECAALWAYLTQAADP